MADNYLESQYEEYLARKEAEAKGKGKKDSKLKGKNLMARNTALNNKHRDAMKEEYGD